MKQKEMELIKDVLREIISLNDEEFKIMKNAFIEKCNELGVDVKLTKRFANLLGKIREKEE